MEVTKEIRTFDVLWGEIRVFILKGFLGGGLGDGVSALLGHLGLSKAGGLYGNLSLSPMDSARRGYTGSCRIVKAETTSMVWRPMWLRKGGVINKCPPHSVFVGILVRF